MNLPLLITCEHASNAIPAAYQKYFKGHQALLNSHCGFDIGAHYVYQSLIQEFDCLSCKGDWSRLLVDLNRTIGHPHLFSAITKPLNQDLKNTILRTYYWPYHQHVINFIEKLLDKNSYLIHLSIHSHTPILNGETRNNDLSFLYDPSRKREKKFCLDFKKIIGKHYKVRLNYPYLGKSNGLTSALRKQYSEKCYRGIEIEVNQKHFAEDQGKKITADLVQSLRQLMEREIIPRPMQ